MQRLTGVILAGGRGTRLRPFTITVPKPLLPIGDVPILEVVIRQMARAGVDRIVVTLGHLAPLIQAILGDGSRLGVPISYCIEETPLGTAGPLRLVQDPADDVLVINGDILTTLDFREMLRLHRERDAWATIATSHRQVDIDYGVLVIGEDGMLAEYREKPSIHYEVSMGVNLISRRALELIPKDGPFDMPSLMLALKDAGKPVVCYRNDAYWRDIGRFDDYQKASEDFVKEPGRFLPG